MPNGAKRDWIDRSFSGSEFDVIAATSPENTWYLSDAMIDTQRIFPERLALVIWASHSDPIYIVATNEEARARRESWIHDIRGYVEYKESPMPT